MVKPLIRLAQSSDVGSIMRIYNHDVENTNNTSDLVPRTTEQQKIWLSSREGALGVLVAEIDGEVVGFAALSEYRPGKDACRTSVESSLYVDESARRLGIGKKLLNELVELATARGFHTIIARIINDNQVSVNLHLAAHFVTVGIEREIGRKFNAWFDVRIMQKMLA